jgi:hypothetical protein
MFAIVLAAALALTPTSASAQATGGQVDLNQILQQFGPLLGGLGGIGGIPTDGTGTTTQPAEPPTDGGAGSMTRQPITNSLDSVNREGLSNRSPGIWIQNAQAVANGDTEFFTGVPEEEPNFFRATFNEIFTIFTDTFSAIITGANVLIAANTGIPPIDGGMNGTGVGMIPNSATTGAGTTTTLQ